jgi:anti-anti-sigma factor
MSAEVTCDGERVGLRLHGPLDADGAQLLQSLVQEFDHVAHIDLADVGTIDSSGLFAIVNADTRARQCGKRLTLVPPPARARRIFTWTGLDRRLLFLNPA